jgi:hypothetical protein
MLSTWLSLLILELAEVQSHGSTVMPIRSPLPLQLYACSPEFQPQIHSMLLHLSDLLPPTKVSPLIRRRLLSMYAATTYLASVQLVGTDQLEQLDTTLQNLFVLLLENTPVEESESRYFCVQVFRDLSCHA